jgi:ribosomal protein L37E
MVKAKKHVCRLCGNEQELTLDNEVICHSCGYIKKLRKAKQ